MTDSPFSDPRMEEIQGDRDRRGGSSSPLTPGAGDATQVAKDAQPGSVSDSQPPHNRLWRLVTGRRSRER